MPDPGLFSPGASTSPLAVRMRPQSLEQVQGQRHVLGENSPLSRLIAGNGSTSVILYGPAGTGKTTLAQLVASDSARSFQSLSALSAGVKDVRAVIDMARDKLAYGTQTVLFIDEVHRFSKSQQDALLGAVENGIVLLVAATTENPYFSVIRPLLSRSLIVQLHPLTDSDITAVLERALKSEKGLNGKYTLTQPARDIIVSICGGDARRALTLLEAAVGASTEGVIDDASVEKTMDAAPVSYDKNGDQHYDVVSAFIKSIRGSHADAAIHYLARMLKAGEDPRFIARRLMVHASEDIGLADPTALTAAVAAAEVVDRVGLPEARLALTQATIHLALAPKSNAVIQAINAASAHLDATVADPVPPHLRDGHYSGAKKLGNAVQYRYPHDHSHGVSRQQYLPDNLKGAQYYVPVDRGEESTFAARWGRLKSFFAGSD